MIEHYINEKIDLIYIFNYNVTSIDDATERLRCSIKSVSFQKVNVCVCNTSSICIYDKIIDLVPDLKYVHKFYNGPFSKALCINFGVKKLVTTPYFFLSDVDLVYSRDHVQRLFLKCKLLQNDNEDLRFVFYNYNLLPIIETPRTYKFFCDIPILRNFVKNKIKMRAQIVSHDYELLDCKLKEPGGFAHGNGLIHTETFFKIQGYDEEMIGYGPEDDLFNIRISKVNRIIYDKLPDTATFHLWHTRLSWIQVEKNHNIWDQKKEELNKLINPSFEDVKANKNKKEWGVI
jgi:hypothetical protein